MTQPPPINMTTIVAPLRISRRVVLVRWSATGLALIAAMTGWPRPTAAPAVTVMPPTIVQDDCTATITVRLTITVHVTVAHLTPGDRYEVSGDIMESDGADGDADFCGSLAPQSIPFAHGGRHTVILEGRMMAVHLGLVKGIGPASDEPVSPDLVELFAQVRLRNLTTGARDGPWTSPLRTAVAHDVQTWTRPGLLLGSELAVPRAGASSTDVGAASQRCAS